MRLANCKKCGKLFKKLLRDICDICSAVERHELILIFRFIRENPDGDISLKQLHENTGVSIDHLEEYYFSGQLVNAGARIKADCKLCGAEINTITRKGYFCTKCSDKLQEEIGMSTYVDRTPIDISEIKLKTFHKNVFHSSIEKNEKFGFKKIKE